MADTTDPKPGVFWGTLAELVGEVPVVGKALKFLLQRGGGRALVVVLFLGWTFLVYPLLVPLIAAMLINSGALPWGQDSYAANVRSAFRVREAADEANRKLNERLDYYHGIRISMDTREAPTYDIPVIARQRLTVRFSSPSLTSSDSEGCPVPEQYLKEGAELAHVKSGGHLLFTITNTGKMRPFGITPKQWDDLKAGVAQDNRLELRFEAVDDLRKCKGLKLKVNVTVEVFKDLLT